MTDRDRLRKLQEAENLKILIQHNKLITEGVIAGWLLSHTPEEIADMLKKVKKPNFTKKLSREELSLLYSEMLLNVWYATHDEKETRDILKEFADQLIKYR